MVKIMEIRLPHYGRGYHLITQELLSRLPQLPENGLLNLFIKHTSAALTINENADPDVRLDFAAFFDRIVPDGASYFKHIYEGDDDMSAHIKASLLGASLTIPIRGRALDLGTWQGIYLCEFRNGGGARRVLLHIVVFVVHIQIGKSFFVEFRGIEGFISVKGFIEVGRIIRDILFF